MTDSQSEFRCLSPAWVPVNTRPRAISAVNIFDGALRFELFCVFYSFWCERTVRPCACLRAFKRGDGALARHTSRPGAGGPWHRLWHIPRHVVLLGCTHTLSLGHRTRYASPTHQEFVSHCRGFHKRSDLRASRMRVKHGAPPFADDMMISGVILFNSYKARTHPQAYRKKVLPVCFLSIVNHFFHSRPR